MFVGIIDNMLQVDISVVSRLTTSSRTVLYSFLYREVRTRPLLLGIMMISSERRENIVDVISTEF